MKPRTNVTLLLDRSGSMGALLDATIEGFNGYIDGLKAERDAEIAFTFLTFDTGSLDKIYVAEPIAAVAQLSRETYHPRGGTPLIDAAYKTILATEAAVAKDSKVIVCIQTDGQENASTEYKWADLKTLISRKQEDGWEFVFIGAGIDAFDQGEKMGISMQNTMSYGADAISTRAAFAASSSNTAAFASGRRSDLHYTEAQRTAASDLHWDRRQTQTPAAPVLSKRPAPTLPRLPDIGLGGGAAAQRVSRQTVPDVSF